MMRRDRRGLAALLMAIPLVVSAQAAPPSLRPAEDPPADFKARQYVDSSGCVFVRDGKSWTPRRMRDGAPVCGYPPTPVGAADASSAPPEAGPPRLDGLGRVESELLATVVGGLQPGELLGGEAPPTAHATTSPEAGSGVAQTLAAAIAAAPAAARHASRAASPENSRLCDLLGMGPGVAQNPLGSDPTGGFCSGPAAPGPVPRIAAAEAAARTLAAGGASTPPPSPLVAVAEKKSPRPLASAARHGEAQAERPNAARTPEARPAPANMIPAGTRFLRIAAHADPAAAETVLRRVAALGLPVARSKPDAGGRHALLAGPFDSRRAVVRAHDRLTRAGFSGLVPLR